MSDEFKARLAQAEAAARYEKSAARRCVVETYDDITAARSRGVTWQTIADLMNADGLRATDNSELTAGQVAALYTSERLARGERRKRRGKKPPAPPAPTTPDPDDEPPKRGGFRAVSSTKPRT